MEIERAFIGTANLEDILLSLLTNQIDNIIANLYDKDGADAIPSNTEGAAE